MLARVQHLLGNAKTREGYETVANERRSIGDVAARTLSPALLVSANFVHGTRNVTCAPDDAAAIVTRSKSTNCAAQTHEKTGIERANAIGNETHSSEQDARLSRECRPTRGDRLAALRRLARAQYCEPAAITRKLRYYN